MSFIHELINFLKRDSKLAVKCKELSSVWNELGENSQSAESLDLKKIACFQNAVCDHVSTTLEEAQLRLLQHRVTKIRNELDYWWDKCHFLMEEQNMFQAYRSPVFNDNILREHSLQLKKLQGYFEKNGNLFEAVEKYLLKLHRQHQLLLHGTDPQRLANRGAQLLKDDNERKALRKELPKLKKEIDQMIATFFTVNSNKIFTMHGMTFEELITALDSSKGNVNEKNMDGSLVLQRFPFWGVVRKRFPKCSEHRND